MNNQELPPAKFPSRKQNRLNARKEQSQRANSNGSVSNIPTPRIPLSGQSGGNKQNFYKQKDYLPSSIDKEVLKQKDSQKSLNPKEKHITQEKTTNFYQPHSKNIKETNSEKHIATKTEKRFRSLENKPDKTAKDQLKTKLDKKTAENSKLKKASVKVKKEKTRLRKWVKRIFVSLFTLSLLSITAACLLFVWAYYSMELPNPDKFAQAQVSTVYWNDGKTELAKFSARNRTNIELKDLPEYVGQAVVSSEDRSFYDNSGVDLKGIARAIWNNIQGKPLQGASTLSQQYIENYYIGANHSVKGKIKETILAIKINQQLSKETILNNYLNTIYFGRGSYGIEAAAKAYFNKSAKDLSLSEAVVLAGIIPAPSAWDPEVNPEQAKARWERVLNIMQEDGYITEEQKKKEKFPEVIHYQAESSQYKGNVGYIVQHVRQELETAVGYSQDEIDRLGLKVIVTIDPEKQRMMEEAVAKLPPHQENLRIAGVSIDNKTGAILAEYGGKDYDKVQSNAVTQDIVQAGSTFKPFAILAALEQGWSIDDTIDGGPLFLEGREIKNYGNARYGTVTLKKATMNSLNTAFVRLNQQVGMAATRDVAIAAGYPRNTVGLDNDSLLGVIGTSSPHNLDIAQAYSTFANGGIRRDAHIIAKVLDANDNEIYIPDVEGERVFREDLVAQLNVALNATAAAGGTAHSGYFGRPMAAKTGTSENYHSAQYAGFISQMTTVISMYQVGPNGEEESITPFGGVSEVLGAVWPARIFKWYMTEATKGMPVEKLILDEGKNKREVGTKYRDSQAERPEVKPTETNDTTLTPITPMENNEPKQTEDKKTEQNGEAGTETTNKPPNTN